MITGVLRANGIALGEIKVNFHVDPNTGKKALVWVKAAYVDSRTGLTHGWITAGDGAGGPSWSPAVQEKLDELAMQIEKELSQLVMSDVEDASPGPVVEEPGGLGEHLAGDLEPPAA